MRTPGRAARWGTTTAASAMLASYLVLAGPSSGPLQPPLLPSAGTTYLCSGYADCVRAGYSDSGYGAANGTMYWRMYAGHNCTNYAAYRMIQAGMPNVRPWTGEGNASQWGLSMASITDQTPNVGAIAWWGKYSNGAGSAGHVAYVERVVSADEIIVSEDAWGGTFHWRSITRTSGRWPTGFIHFVDRPAPTPTPTPTPTGNVFTQTATPVVAAPLVVNTTVSATAGGWSPTPAENRWRWFADGVRIGDIVTPDLALTPDLVGKTLSMRVVAKSDGFTTYVSPFYTLGPVLAGIVHATAPATLSGTPALGQVLTAAPGTYDQPDAAPAYQWLRNGVAIPGATAATYQLAAEDVGSSVSVEVSGTKAQYAPAVETLTASGPVTSPANVILKTKSKHGRAIVRVRVTAAGKLPVTGKVLVRIGSWKREVRLSDGIVKVKVPMARGTKKVRVRYLGSAAVPAAPKVVGTVQVR
ncbi:CHAP domain-containing protein [Nocardioides sp. QY071]|uniref:CHAP domain-containing protein n=1 Tax=Nocardioides sp. QY071 TaxID=3044187 RepID=UPI00249B3D26|nr:CHAP domain-containing protein [Nocardioides sp. QY071]WGY00654.1 CHAP domain-containing protein [Nocardioides sp. QY071]